MTIESIEVETTSAAATAESQQQSAPAETEASPPSGPVTIDLDILERDGEIPPPFTFKLADRSYRMHDPNEAHWRDLLVGLSNPVQMVQYLIHPDDKEAFLEARLPAWKLNKLLRSYLQHYNLPLDVLVGSPMSP